MNLSQALDEFINNARANGLKPPTIAWYASIIKQMVQGIGDIETIDVTTRTMRQYVVELRERTTRYQSAPQRPEEKGAPSEATIAAHLRAIHRFWAWSSDEYDMPNPMKGIKRPKQQKPRPKAITSSDFVKLWQATGEGVAGMRDKALLAMLADTGARIGGLINLRVKDCDVVQRRAIVTEKGNKERVVYFTSYTASLLLKWLYVREVNGEHVFTNLDTGAPLTASGVHQILKRLRAKTNVRGRINPHAFRHAFAREYIRSGGDIATLAKILGHEDVNITASYYAVFDDRELREFHDKHSPMRSLRDELDNEK